MFKTNFTITVARSFTRFTMIDVLARSNSDRDTTGLTMTHSYEFNCKHKQLTLHGWPINLICNYMQTHNNWYNCTTNTR